MASNPERAALERRLAAMVEAWRQPCPHTVHHVSVPDGGWRGELRIGAEHAAACPGWIPGVAEPDGTARRIHAEDVFAAANSAAHRVSPEASIHDVMDFDALLLTNPDAIFMAQGAQLAEWLESEGALTDALEAQDA